MNVYTTTRRVTPEDLDELEHVNNVRYVQWIQDISKAHWEAVVPEVLRSNMIWVVRRHDIRYKGAAFLGEQLHMRSYIAKNEGFISSRIVEIRKEDNGTPILISQTDWCLLNRESGKPMRISPEIHTLFETPSP